MLVSSLVAVPLVAVSSTDAPESTDGTDGVREIPPVLSFSDVSRDVHLTSTHGDDEF